MVSLTETVEMWLLGIREGNGEHVMGTEFQFCQMKTDSGDLFYQLFK